MPTPAQREQPTTQPDPAWTEQDRAVLARVEPALADGAALLRWWRQTDAANAYANRFPIVQTFNQPDESFAYLDAAPLPRGVVPVMGLVEDMLYDQPKGGADPLKIREEFREFVLHYFMRVSAFERPEAYTDQGRSPPKGFPSLSWCPEDKPKKVGFGYSQWYYKLKGSGRVGKFSDDERFRIVDLREIGSTYEWVVVKVRIYDFNLTVQPRGQDSLQLTLPLREESYLVLSPDFVLNEEDPEPGLLGRYGFGYAFIEDPVLSGPLRYGPGRFSASFQLIHFRVQRSGQINADLVFAVNRPEQILSVPFAPFDWGLRLADLFSLGMARPVLRPLQAVAGRWPFSVGQFDPIGNFVVLANLVTGGVAGRDYCISKEQLEKQFLVQHFMQHYQLVTNSVLTWRQYANWSRRDAIPEEVQQGVTT